MRNIRTLSLGCTLLALGACHDLAALKAKPRLSLVDGGVGETGSDGGGASEAGTGSAQSCKSPQVEACYDGPAGSDKGGACRAGERRCMSGGTWGLCEGQVTPADRCATRECGSDGCGGSCGTCEAQVACDESSGRCSRERMVEIPEGPFSMGSPVGETGRAADEPAHTVTLAAFSIDETEVTNQAYLGCVLDEKCEPPTRCDSGLAAWPGPLTVPSDRKLSPVVCVSWSMAKTYCESAGKRLCTEAEWERAASGAVHRVYPWGDTFPVDPDKYLNCSETYCFDEFVETSPVGAFTKGKTSGSGIADMAGNVSEWVLDYYESDFYSTGSQLAPKGPCDGASPCKTLFARVQRGGSFDSESKSVRVAARAQRDETSREPFLGFRCCR